MASSVERIAPEEVYRRIERGEDLVLLDVRTQSWQESDVKARGALRISPDEIESRYTELPKGKEIVAYCT